MYSISQNKVKIGIDDMAIHLPKLYLPISELAEARQIEYAKLNKGLGLTNMSVTDVHEDAATMAANAVRELIEKNNIHPTEIGRIYLGTESALDGAKPTATYVQDMLQQYFEPTYGKDCLLHCDIVDLTFACIGAVDAMQNTLDWVAGQEGRMGIVVASDIAKYELGSTGEYTQGAGAVAVLIKQSPRLIALNSNWGVATKPVHDFFKPIRKITKEAVINEVLSLAGISSITAEELLAKQNGHLYGKGVIDLTEAYVTLHKDTPVFDGPYSNDCYQERIKEALQHYAHQKNLSENEVVTEAWSRLIFHLPYAYQARRMFSELFMFEMMRGGQLDQILEDNQLVVPNEEDFEGAAAFQKARRGFLKALSKTNAYRNFVAEKIEKGERASSHVGNLYTGSIFLGLMSALEADLKEDQELTNQVLGFFAYGSGSKSKVFTGQVQEQWREVVATFNLNEKLESRKAIDYSTYDHIHRKKLDTSVLNPTDEFYLKAINLERNNSEGARTYAYKAPVAVKV